MATTTGTPTQMQTGRGAYVRAYLKVHHRGASDADVTEGSGGIWERLHYDWSDPNRTVMTTTDSNLWAGTVGKSVLQRAFDNTAKAIEDRNTR